MRTLCLLFAFWISGLQSASALDFPPPPQDYVYDDAGVVDANTRASLYQLLHEEDVRTGNQVLVAVFRGLQGEDLVDFTNRLFTRWTPGQKERNNGALLAFYMQEHKIRIEVGYGLEGVLTDARTRQIIEDDIVPSFKSGNFSQGIYNGTRSVVSLITNPDASRPVNRGYPAVPHLTLGSLLLIAFVIWVFFRGLRRSLGFSSRGYRTYYHPAGFLTGLLLGRGLGRRSSWGGGGWGSGGGGWGGGGGGGGFFGGGGSSGGGGASGSW